MKLRNLILLITIGLAALLIFLKLAMLIIPVIGTGLTAFLILAGKAYLGRKVGKFLEEKEDDIKEAVK